MAGLGLRELKSQDQGPFQEGLPEPQQQQQAENQKSLTCQDSSHPHTGSSFSASQPWMLRKGCWLTKTGYHQWQALPLEL